MTTTQNRSPERPWATGVLVVAGAISLSFNVRHSLHATALPGALAFIYGAGPVILAAAQSHVVALQAARGELIGGWRKAFTFSLVIGALALSFLGIYDLLQHTVPDPIGATAFNEPAVLTPIVIDLMAIAALHELLRPAGQLVNNHPAVTAPQVVTGPVDLTVPASFRPPVTTTVQGGQPAAGTTGHLTGNDHRSATLNEPVATVPDNHPNDHPSDQRSTGAAAGRATAPKTGRSKGGRQANNGKASRPTTDENAQAVQMYRESVASGDPLSQRVLAAKFDRSPGWARDRIKEAGLRPVGDREQPVTGTAVDQSNDHHSDHLNDQSNDHSNDQRAANE